MITRTERADYAAHAPNCQKREWAVQARILTHGPLIARCLGCGAVKKIEEAAK